MTVEQIESQYAYLYHMAELGSWDSIQKHGLLSTTALLDLFEVNGSLRSQLESEHRPKSVVISHPLHGKAVVRDQKPMDDVGLKRALQDNLTPPDWYRILNRKVFFWLTIDRLERMLGAQAYKNQRHLVLTIKAATILKANAKRIELCRMNSGCTKPFPHPRGLQTFKSIGEYPDANWSRPEPIVELTVDYSVEDIGRHVISVQEAGAGKANRLVWENRN